VEQNVFGLQAKLLHVRERQVAKRRFSLFVGVCTLCLGQHAKPRHV
jgi:hypothetical protein